MAQLRFLFILVVCAASVVQRTNANATGACPASCSNLIPEHEGATAVPGAAPAYTLTAPQKVAAGSTNIVKIGGGPFKGFILRVLNAQNSGGGSYFEAGDRYKAMKCDAKDDTATHTDATPKTSVSVQWVAPTGPGTYRLVATIVKEFSTYYTGYTKDVVVQ